MPAERGGGPISMSPEELADFLGGAPTGAICVTDADGRLLALPARVLDQEDQLLKVEVDGFEVPPQPGTAACIVADRFPSYGAIRGVIVQGSISSAENAASSRSKIALAVARTVTFSFANVTM